MEQSNQLLSRTNAAAGLYAELWISLSSLLRSYTVAHGLHNNIYAEIEIDESRIFARHGMNWLELVRTGAEITSRRDDGRSELLHLTPTGHLRSNRSDTELDMAAEAWARDLMRESPRESKQ